METDFQVAHERVQEFLHLLNYGGVTDDCSGTRAIHIEPVGQKRMVGFFGIVERVFEGAFIAWLALGESPIL
jgi:hypothetical protein